MCRWLCTVTVLNARCARKSFLQMLSSVTTMAWAKCRSSDANIMRKKNKPIQVTTEQVLLALKSTLNEFHIPEPHYSILKERDGTACLMRDGEKDGWSVFYYERAYRHSERKHTTLFDACQDILWRFSDNKRQYWKMQKLFRKHTEQYN